MAERFSCIAESSERLKNPMLWSWQLGVHNAKTKHDISAGGIGLLTVRV